MIGAMLGPVFPLWILNVLHASVSRVFFIMAIMGAGTLALNVFAGHFLFHLSVDTLGVLDNYSDSDSQH